MIIIPAVDMMDHRVVQLVGGVPGSEKITMPDPFKAAMEWVDKGAEYLHLVDLDAAFGKEGNLDVIKKIITGSGVPVEVGGGIRSREIVRELADAGADRIILGTKAINDTNWLIDISNEFPGKIVLALDTKNNEITVKGWQESSRISLNDMFNIIRELPLAGVLNTNVDVEGQGKGIADVQVDFVKRCPHKVIASGGISSKEDAVRLSEAGAAGAVVGVAIYTGMLEPWAWKTPWRA